MRLKSAAVSLTERMSTAETRRLTIRDAKTKSEELIGGAAEPLGEDVPGVTQHGQRSLFGESEVNSPRVLGSTSKLGWQLSRDER